MKKNPEMTNATRQTLVDAFCILAKKNPVEKITVREIMKRAGYNRSTFYQYFRDVYDLLDYVEDSLISRVLENMMINFDAAAPESMFMEAFGRLHEEAAEYYDVIVQDAYFPHFEVRFKKSLLPVMAEKLNLPEDGKSLYLLDFYLSGIVAVIVRWLRNGRNLPPESIAQMIHSLFKDGIVPQLKKV